MKAWMLLMGMETAAKLEPHVWKGNSCVWPEASTAQIWVVPWDPIKCLNDKILKLKILMWLRSSVSLPIAFFSKVEVILLLNCFPKDSNMQGFI